MNAARELVVFHYHLLPGGVTSVIRLSARAILEHVPEIERVRLVVGGPPDAGSSHPAIPAAPTHAAPPPAAGRRTIETELLPEIGYVDARRFARGPGAAAELRERVEWLERELTRRYGGAIWWVHNYHLGKNPAFTEALLRIAAARPEQRIVLHIHDFPECGRYENVALLHRTVNVPLYPLLPNVRYVVINERDRRYLVEAGVPAELLFYLPDPVPHSAPHRETPGGGAGHAQAGEREAEAPPLRPAALAAAFSKEPGRFDPSRPLLLYPVRTIRRKNVLEAALVARLAAGDANLVVTLPGRSDQELGYSSFVERCYRQGLVRGMVGIGARLDQHGISFDELVECADAVLSTSVQEGFGYFFIDSLRWRKPLVARWIDILDGMDGLLDLPSVSLYGRLVVPLDDAERRAHRALYDERIRALEAILPGGEPERVRTAIRGAFERDDVDFSFLSLEAQARALASLHDPGYSRAVLRLNDAALAAMRRAFSSPASDASDRIEARYGLSVHAAGIRAIVGSFERRVPLPADGGAVHERLLARHASIENVRLLLA